MRVIYGPIQTHFARERGCQTNCRRKPLLPHSPSSREAPVEGEAEVETNARHTADRMYHLALTIILSESEFGTCDMFPKLPGVTNANLVARLFRVESTSPQTSIPSLP